MTITGHHPPFRPTRRTLFGVIAAVPIPTAVAAEAVISTPAFAYDRSLWNAAEAAFDKAEANHMAACEMTGALFEAADGQPLFDIQADACAAATDAFYALLRTRAPDVAAVKRKVRLAMEHDDAFMLGFVLVDLDRLIEAAA
jgi:hypothetical protein